MRESDLRAVQAVAEVVHPAYPEDAAIFAERLRLYGGGCLVFEDSASREIAAYVVSHPWRANDPPALNEPLGALPREAGTYYIHDLALLPWARGLGIASATVDRLVAVARTAGLPTVSLIAVNGSTGFWRRHGFEEAASAGLRQKLRSYDAAAQFMVRTL